MTPLELSHMVDEFEKTAFSANFADLLQRKKALEFIIAPCSDSNLRYILGIAVGYLGKHPEWTSSEISKARGHIKSLEYLRSK